MTATALTPVRLTDIPFAQRMAAARTAAKTCATPNEAHAVLAAALAPSDRVYWIRTAAAIEALAA